MNVGEFVSLFKNVLLKEAEIWVRGQLLYVYL